MKNCRILFVDDDRNVLQGYQRQLRRRFEVDIADGPEQGLAAIENEPPYAVVVSDMRMPGMDGIRFLVRVRELAADTMRVMLTGYTDRGTALGAVNNGHIYSFLEKPCPIDRMTDVLNDAIEIYNLKSSERDLLSRTLAGSVSLLTDILSLTNPDAYGRASRVRHIVRSVCSELDVGNAWEVEVAAMLSQVGCVSLPEQMLVRAYRGGNLSHDEKKMLQSLPEVGKRLVARIPRLENVAEIIGRQGESYQEGLRANAVDLEERQRILGSQILRAALDFDGLLMSGRSNESALQLMSQQAVYNPEVLGIFSDLFAEFVPVKSLKVDELAEGMILDEHVRTVSGELLVASGHEVSSSLKARLKNFAASQAGVRQPIRVKCPSGLR
jgi:response regulator RpfG family c-di-GMP phosphodiesterase